MKIEIQFERSKDPRIDYYYVYRSKTPFFKEGLHPIMKVKQPFLPTPKRVNERVVKNNGKFTLKYPIVDGKEKEIVVKNKGQTIKKEQYVVVNSRHIIIHENMNINEIDVSYDADVIVVKDSKEEQKYVEYYGPQINIKESNKDTIYYYVQGFGLNGIYSNKIIKIPAIMK